MKVQCEHCNEVYAVDDNDFGIEVICGHCEQLNIVPESRFAPRMILDDFVIRDFLGKGGMGSVLLAHQLSLERDVALKILLERFNANDEYITDFIKEARNAAKLNHPNIAQAYAVGQEDSIYFFAMELIDGLTVKQIMGEEPVLDIEWSLNVVRQVALGLDHAWSMQRLVHRDIKPDNIMIRSHDRAVKLTDLGLAKPESEIDFADEDIVGTPQYICPEVVVGNPMDVRGDIYSLGATLFHMVTGRFAFLGATAMEIAERHVKDPLDNPLDLRPDLPEGAGKIITKMMAKSPEDRYEDPKALVAALDRVISKMTTKSGKRQPRTLSDSRRLKALQAAATSTNYNMKAVVIESNKITETDTPPKKKLPPWVLIGGGVAALIVFLALIFVLTANDQPTATAGGAGDASTTDGVLNPGASERLKLSDKQFDELVVMLSEAREYAASHPKDLYGQIQRYKKVRSEGFGTKFHELAHKEIVRLRELRSGKKPGADKKPAPAPKKEAPKEAAAAAKPKTPPPASKVPPPPMPVLGEGAAAHVKLAAGTVYAGRIFLEDRDFVNLKLKRGLKRFLLTDITSIVHTRTNAGAPPPMTYETTVHIIDGRIHIGTLEKTSLLMKTGREELQFLLGAKVTDDDVKKRPKQIANIKFPQHPMITSRPVRATIAGFGTIQRARAYDTLREQILSPKVSGNQVSFNNVLPGAYDICIRTTDYLLLGISPPPPPKEKVEPLTAEDKKQLLAALPKTNHSTFKILDYQGTKERAKTVVYSVRNNDSGMKHEVFALWIWKHEDGQWKSRRKTELMRFKLGAKKSKAVMLKELAGCRPGAAIKLDEAKIKQSLKPLDTTL